MRPQQRSGTQVERRAHEVENGRAHLGTLYRRHRLRTGTIDFLERHCNSRVSGHRLHHFAVDLDKSCAQDLMSGNHFGEGASQCVRTYRTAKMQNNRHVVVMAVRVQSTQEPHSLLGE
ncbi:Uncharacterised protein [Mycobacteroides abscessus subsp. massiliense]|nr:Uncharacterised protein [Mycobacteroides abscessus subsp. massiliense]